MARNTLRMHGDIFFRARIGFVFFGIERHARLFGGLLGPRGPSVSLILISLSSHGAMARASVCKFFSVSIANSRRKFVLLESSAISTTLVSTYSRFFDRIFCLPSSHRRRRSTRDCSKHLNPIVESQFRKQTYIFLIARV